MSDAMRWVREGYLPKPDDQTRYRIAREMRCSYWTAYFAVKWIECYASTNKTIKSRLLKILSSENREGLFWLIGWLDSGLGTKTLGISEYSAVMASYITREWDRIKSNLAA